MLSPSSDLGRQHRLHPNTPPFRMQTTKSLSGIGFITTAGFPPAELYDQHCAVECDCACGFRPATTIRTSFDIFFPRLSNKRTNQTKRIINHLPIITLTCTLASPTLSQSGFIRGVFSSTLLEFIVSVAFALARGSWVSDPMKEL